MKKVTLSLLFTVLLVGICGMGNALAAREHELIYNSIQVLDEIMSIPEQSIPPSLLANAQAVAIFPGMLKGGFILGARYGTGLIVVRRPNGWSNPVFYKIVGGSVGFQIGAQAIDVILVFKTPRSLDYISSGKFTLGGDASAAAGPVGRHAEASTDTQLAAEIYSYSRSRGLFAGVSLTGSSIQVDYSANSSFYGTAGLLPMEIFTKDDPNVPPIVDDLKKAISRHAGSGVVGAGFGATP